MSASPLEPYYREAREAAREIVTLIMTPAQLAAVSFLARHGVHFLTAYVAGV